MKKVYLLKSIFASAALLLSTALTAQVSIPADSANYVIGNDTKVNVIDNASSFSAGSGGAGLVWDFSGLAAGTERTLSVEQVKSGGLNPDPVSAALKVVISKGLLNDVYYYDPSSSGLGYAGQQYGINVLNYAGEGAVQWTYPITYLDSSTVNVSKTYSTGFGPTSVDHDISGQVTSVVDAYGRIKMPYGDVYDVLRIKITELITDTADVPLIGNQVYNYDNIMYEWRVASNQHMILRYARKKEGSTTTRPLYYQVADSVELQPEPSSVLMQMPDLPELIISPNPANDKISLSFDVLSNEQIEGLKVLDLSGRVASNLDIRDYRSNVYLESYDVSNLRAGNYILQVKTNQRNIQKRFVVK